MITRIIIEHFKSIEHLDLEFADLTVLVGRNAAGKSNIVDAIMFVRDVIRHGLDRAVSQRHGIDSIRQWTYKGARHVTLTVFVKGSWGNGHLSFTLGSNKGSYVIKREDAEWKETYENDPIYDEDNELIGFETTTVRRKYDRDANGMVTIYTTGITRRTIKPALPR